MSAREPKKPRRNQFKHNFVGIEIEFISTFTRDDLAKLIEDAGMDHKIHIKNDSSITGYDSDEEESHEMAILCKQKYLESTLKKVQKILTICDARVNDSCGLHVHLDMFHRNREKAFYNLVAAQDLLYSMVKPNRIHKRGMSGRAYCLYNPMNPKSAGLGHFANHYYGINTAALNEHGTIELRMHEGTVDTKEIFNWCKMLNAIVDYHNEIDIIDNNIYVNGSMFELDTIEYIERKRGFIIPKYVGNKLALTWGKL